jgi:serine phosphatase RsbU (regulator of sigma subunit)
MIITKRKKQILDFFKAELDNFQNIASYLKPHSGSIPDIPNIDVYGEVIPLNQIVGGDHIIYVDFAQRYDLEQRIQKAKEEKKQWLIDNLIALKTKAAILIADVSGHQITDALLAAMLHQAFLIGVIYELNQYGQITTALFENLNTRFYNSSSFTKFISLIYGEISSDGNFRFINAGHPAPFIYSYKYSELFKLFDKKTVHYPPLGTLPSLADIDAKKNKSRLGFKKMYPTHEIRLMGEGDILILYTDGFTDHVNAKQEYYVERQLKKRLDSVKHRSAKEIFQVIKTDLLDFAPIKDDASFVIIKRSTKPAN